MKDFQRGAWHVDSDRGLAKDVQIVQWFFALEEVFAWHMGVVVDGVSFKRSDSVWRMTVQGRRALGGSKRRNLVTWFWGDDVWECMWVAARAVKANQVTWHSDKYPVIPVT